ncbi:IclR family transcriptional regulator [Sphingobium sp. Sx8-8]|uniref:IclR family transcriptional regulator n=1 Tax=Sphingobium sp. Sx8-8 TaxID=2933617 RepID=UPI001F587B17|nr:IclR family transcriptional regulator [Sphingobium sp. Sx8-8]
MASQPLIDKTLDIIEAVGASGSASMPQIQQCCGLSLTTTHRIVKSLVRRGFLMRSGRADFRLGGAIVALARQASPRDILAAIARPHLLSLSKLVRCHVHLGVWEGGMVTYVVKQRFGKVRIHSAEGMQLEGYCSALGKILLSSLAEDELERYLADGAFVPLTSNTLVDPDEIRDAIDAVRIQGWSTDEEEMVVGLRCAAVPIRDRAGKIVAAISVSHAPASPAPFDTAALVARLHNTASAISTQLFPPGLHQGWLSHPLTSARIDEAP